MDMDASVQVSKHARVRKPMSACTHGWMPVCVDAGMRVLLHCIKLLRLHDVIVRVNVSTEALG